MAHHIIYMMRVKKIFVQKNGLNILTIKKFVVFIMLREMENGIILINPFAFNVSAQSTAPPAAPRTVLCERPTNLKS